MDSRTRVQLAINHQEADRVPLDLEGSIVTGMHGDTVYLLRQALKLDPPCAPVKILDIIACANRHLLLFPHAGQVSLRGFYDGGIL